MRIATSSGLIFQALAAMLFFFTTAPVEAQNVGTYPSIREICFARYWAPIPSAPITPQLRQQPVLGAFVRLRIKNPSWHDYADICIFDNVCSAVRFRGLVMPHSSVQLKTCADRHRRGSILILERLGRNLRYDKLRNQTIVLPISRTRR